MKPATIIAALVLVGCARETPHEVIHNAAFVGYFTGGLGHGSVFNDGGTAVYVTTSPVMCSAGGHVWPARPNGMCYASDASWAATQDCCSVPVTVYTLPTPKAQGSITPSVSGDLGVPKP